MTNLLLLGAGFSRNWGGPLASQFFEHLLGDRDIRGHAGLHALLWKTKDQGGFETALAQVQQSYLHDPKANSAQLACLQGALLSLFKRINEHLASMPFEFHNYTEARVDRLLVRFDAVFTLNQDLLLEKHYAPSANLASGGRLAGVTLPGMQPLPKEGNFGLPQWADVDWSALPKEAFKLDHGFQPIYKLHGSSNWKDPGGGDLLVLGGQKLRTIRSNDVLSWYTNVFEMMLGKPDTRLTIIGYGFMDEHINSVITTGVAQGLELFVIDPRGSGLARDLNPTAKPGAIYSPTVLEEVFMKGLAGASTLGLAPFLVDKLEYDKLKKFMGQG